MATRNQTRVISSQEPTSGVISVPRFIGEPAQGEFSSAGTTPAAFAWNDTSVRGVDILSEWQDFGFRGTRPSARTWRTRRHRNYYRVPCDYGHMCDTYLDRGSGRREWPHQSRLQAGTRTGGQGGPISPDTKARAAPTSILKNRRTASQSLILSEETSSKAMAWVTTSVTYFVYDSWVDMRSSDTRERTEAIRNSGLIPCVLTPPNQVTSTAPITGPASPITPCPRLSQQPIAVARSLFRSELPHTIPQLWLDTVDPHHQITAPIRATAQSRCRQPCQRC